MVFWGSGPPTRVGFLILPRSRPTYNLTPRAWHETERVEIGETPSPGAVRTVTRIRHTTLGYTLDSRTLRSASKYWRHHASGLPSRCPVSMCAEGIVPSQIGYLEFLRHLDVSGNPSLGYLGDQELANLNLNPGLPAEIGLLTRLESLKLDYCGFSGTIPPSIGELRYLEQFLARGTTVGLNAATNRFSGTLPTEIGQMDSLMRLALNDK